MQTIDGVKIDINIVSLNHIFSLIEQDHRENASYYPSVFNTGVVLKNEEGVVDFIKDRVNEHEKFSTLKREMQNYEEANLGNLYMEFINMSRDTIYDDYLYYNLLEKIRTNYFYLHNYSRVGFNKVYDCFKNSRCINTYYQLKLPDRKFMDFYLEALFEKDYKARLEILNNMFAMIDINTDLLYSEKIYLDEYCSGLDLKMVYLREKIAKVEMSLISEHPASDYVYYVALYRLQNLMWLINDEESHDAMEEFSKALLSTDIDARIKSLENIFTYVSKSFNIDFDNYLIKKY